MLQLLETCTVQYCTGTFFFFIIPESRFKYTQTYSSDVIKNILMHRNLTN